MGPLPTPPLSVTIDSVGNSAAEFFPLENALQRMRQQDTDFSGDYRFTQAVIPEKDIKLFNLIPRLGGGHSEPVKKSTFISRGSKCSCIGQFSI